MKDTTSTQLTAIKETKPTDSMVVVGDKVTTLADVLKAVAEVAGKFII
jgi:hypothetical protein